MTRAVKSILTLPQDQAIPSINQSGLTAAVAAAKMYPQETGGRPYLPRKKCNLIQLLNTGKQGRRRSRIFGRALMDGYPKHVAYHMSTEKLNNPGQSQSINGQEKGVRKRPEPQAHLHHQPQLTKRMRLIINQQNSLGCKTANPGHEEKKHKLKFIRIWGGSY